VEDTVQVQMDVFVVIEVKQRAEVRAQRTGRISGSRLDSSPLGRHPRWWHSNRRRLSLTRNRCWPGRGYTQSSASISSTPSPDSVEQGGKMTARHLPSPPDSSSSTLALSTVMPSSFCHERLHSHLLGGCGVVATVVALADLDCWRRLRKI
jgi:hypothetical protein